MAGGHRCAMHDHLSFSAMCAAHHRRGRGGSITLAGRLRRRSVRSGVGSRLVTGARHGAAAGRRHRASRRASIIQGRRGAADRSPTASASADLANVLLQTKTRGQFAARPAMREAYKARHSTMGPARRSDVRAAARASSIAWSLTDRVVMTRRAPQLRLPSSCFTTRHHWQNLWQPRSLRRTMGTRDLRCADQTLVRRSRPRRAGGTPGSRGRCAV